MVFNWFRRKFTDDKDAKKQEGDAAGGDRPEDRAAEASEGAPSDTAEPPEPEPSENNDPQTAAAPTTSEDYLAWAKAAYQNIQKRQAQVDATPAESPVAEPAPVEPPTVESEVEPEVAPAIESEVEPEVAPAIESKIEPEVESAATQAEPQVEELPPPTAATEPSAEDASREVAPEPTPIVTNEPATDATQETEETEANVPIWARAAAERQARMERLKAEAVETSAQDLPGEISGAIDAEFDVAFDDDFLWSAEVLAAQGRRPEDISIEEINWLQRLRQGLAKTRRSLTDSLKAIVGAGPLNAEAVEEIEALLLQADVGVEATEEIVEALQTKLREETLPPEEAIAYLKEIVREMLDAPLRSAASPILEPIKDSLSVWLIVGVNGAGKTTTIGKLAHTARKSDFKCLIAAADTFRAAAVEQVKIWGERSGVEAIANPGKNADPAAVVFDAIGAARSRGTELLLIDTAGRLQNKKNLMEELGKIRRVIDKKAPDAIVQSLLVLDATLGQNGLRQAEAFSEVANLSGAIVTKLDSTAKGGIAISVARKLGLPIRFIGAGEGIEDLRPFSSYEFVEALLSD